MKTSLINYLEETVARVPNRVAVWDSSKEYSFLEVAKRSQEFARRLHAVNQEKGRMVGVFLPKCVGVNIANFGTLMSGNAFMNLDVKTPIERIDGVLKTVEPIAIVTNAKFRPTVESIWGGVVIDIDEIIRKPIDDIEYVSK